MKKMTLKIGDRVLTADGIELGKVSQVAETCFFVDAPKKRDFWLAIDAVENRTAGIVLLRFDNNRLDEAGILAASHMGMHDHAVPGAGGKLSILAPLLVLGGAGFAILRSRERRSQVADVARNAKENLMARRRAEDYSADQPGVGFGTTSTLSATMPGAAPREPMATTGATITDERKDALTRLVTAAFPGRDLRIDPVTVHRLDGGTEDTLRFTLDSAVSTDVDERHLQQGLESDEAVARLVIADLEGQLPPDEKHS